MFTKAPRILYFLNGDTPSHEEYATAMQFGPNTVFRNSQYITESALEACDGVAGDVPAAYAAAFPSAETAVEAYVAAMKAAATPEQPQLDLGGGKQPAPASGTDKAPEQGTKEAKAAWQPNAPK